MAPSVLVQDTPSVASDELGQLPNSESSKGYWDENPEPSLLHRSLHQKPLVAVSASGHEITLHNGSRVIDACGGAAVAILGHGNMEVIEATFQQMKQVSYVHTLAYTTTSSEELADLLVGDAPGGLIKAFFVGSGSEANDGAMKLARQFFFEKGETQRTHFIARRQGYHGNTFGSMSLSNNVSRLLPYKDVLLPNVSHVSPCYEYQFRKEGESSVEYVARLAAELDAEFQRVGPGNVIAFVAETVGGATSGCITAEPGYHAAMRDVCWKHGALYILDEIMCGMGRTGSTFAWQQEKDAEGNQVSPDIMTLGKGLGGGYAPIAAIIVNKKVIEVLDRGTGAFNHGHTYQAHPVSCATALAVQKIVHREKLVENCDKMGQVLEGLLREYLGGQKHVGDIRGRGLFYAVEFVQDRESKEPIDTTLNFGYALQKQSLDLGVAVYPGHGTIDGVKGDHIIIAPPYTVNQDQLENIVKILAAAYTMTVKKFNL
ncbi:Pyridoxal phosphate-dependent transferase major region subdomain 2 [Penicillium taxi]|uniref:Pyridoxal phosphate-dependent transferase major region subdomain 2 n=1 Tax=Penicillium taxi TaxID=168475 RepID=UPI00254528F2|nr:Pyridoxal phosphate-dependent transferase major region subdomain 2 [Penicillium taxi]KAJ5887950.1 Pyridoxal phosphate-dependent transferase major region subdomain 2 [Penicillium taxi]